MLLVVLGTEKYSFTRPLLALEAYLKENLLGEDVVVQAGYTQFVSTRMKIIPFFNLVELEKLYEEARVVICHGGTGSVVTGVKLGRKVIVVPRLKKYGEHIDDHQLELVNAFSEKNYIMPWEEGVSILDIFNRIDDFEPAEFISGRDAIVDFVDSFIQGV